MVVSIRRKLKQLINSAFHCIMKLGPPTLQEHCLKACSKCFSKLPLLNKADLQVIHTYLERASPLVHEISQSCYYYFYGSRTLLFIPFLLQKELILTDQNINEVSLWLNSYSCIEQKQLIKLNKLAVNAPKAENYFKILPLISKIPHVKKLELTSWTTDDVLAAIGMHCKNLELFDARGEAETVVTDVGLGFLSQCKTLKMILFSNIADEYDYEDKFKFTGKGIALLMLSLKNLVRIECPEYLLRDALQYIYQMNFQNPALPLKYLFLAYPDVPAQTISLLPYLCPHLETLSIYLPCGSEPIISSSVKRLLSLKKLKLKFEISCNVVALNMVDYKSQIDYLIIDAQYLHEDDVYELDRTFSRLKTLVLIIHSFGFVTRTLKSGENAPIPNLFSQLQSVQLDQRVSGKLFKLICIHVKKLKALYCQHAIIYDVDSVIEFIISKGGWSHLEILVLPQANRFCCNFLFSQMSKLSNLRFLVVKFLGSVEEEKFVTLLSQTKLNICLCHVDDVPRPSKEFIAI